MIETGRVKRANASWCHWWEIVRLGFQYTIKLTLPVTCSRLDSHKVRTIMSCGQHPSISQLSQPGEFGDFVLHLLTWDKWHESLMNTPRRLRLVSLGYVSRPYRWAPLINSHQRSLMRGFSWPQGTNQLPGITSGYADWPGCYGEFKHAVFFRFLFAMQQMESLVSNLTWWQC